MFTATLVLTLLGFALGGLLGLAARAFAVDENPLADEIEALLPNSQCGQCGFPGCKPLAQAIVEGQAEINSCPPGGRVLAEKIADIMGVDVNSIGEPVAPMLASINAELCTGCTRCYKVCPTDAIVGANKQIHSVINKACTGCAKCQEACPEDCIELQPEGLSLNNWHWPKPQTA